MTAFALLSFCMMFGYVCTAVRYYGIPNMLSDTFYQLGKEGWLFSVTLFLAPLLMLMSILDTGQGIQPFAFIGLVGLMFVGCAPNYLEQDEYKVHKTAAIISAVGSISWCLSVCPYITAAIALVYLCYLCYKQASETANEMWHIGNTTPTFHPWFWAEISCFVDVYATYFYITAD